MLRSSMLLALILVGCGGQEVAAPSDSGHFRATLDEMRGANTRDQPIEAKTLIGVLVPGMTGGFVAFDSSQPKDSRSISVDVPGIPEPGTVLPLAPKARAAGNGVEAAASVEYWDNTAYGNTAAERTWHSVHGSLRIDDVRWKEKSVLLDVTVLDAWMEGGGTTDAQSRATGTFYVNAQGTGVELSLFELR